MFGRRSEETNELQRLLDSAHARIAALEAERALLVTRDSRTGMAPVDAFRAAATRELGRARRSGAPVSLALFDVDGFRTLNATRGSAAGDLVLGIVADALRDATRTSDVLGRTGADELAVLLCDTSLDGAIACAQRVVDTVASALLPDASEVTISAGVAHYARGGGVETLLAAAGAGLDVARAAGGGRVCVAAHDDHAAPAPAHVDVIDALATTLTERDRYTGEHSESVVDMACSVATSLGLAERDVQRIGQAALLHDIGKVAIPDQILNKPSGLTEDEWQLMREHPVIGERILRAIPGMTTIARIVRHEHESFDGSGYPDGLAGEQIPLGSRIILACDSYHAITSDRPYRAARPHTDAIVELARCAGTQFDPRVTETLIGHLHAQRQAGQLA
jgi:diguanylate cyclase (GGDEF)-like protein